MKDDMFVMTMYAGALFIAFYKNAKDHFDEESYKEFFRNAGYDDVEYHVIRGRMSCMIAVIRKQACI